MKFRQAKKLCKTVLEAAKPPTLIKQTITSQKLGPRDSWQIANSILNRSKSVMLTIFNGSVVLSSVSDKVKVFAERFSNNFNCHDSGILLPAFSSRGNLKLHNIPVRNFAYFLIFSIVSGIHDQLYIFLQLYLIELLEFL